MGGFCQVTRRIATLGLAFGLVIVIPNVARAQAPPGQTESRLPWQTGQVFSPSKVVFGDSWSRVLSEIRAFADLHRYGGAGSMSPMESATGSSLWATDFRSYVPPSPGQPTVYIGDARVTPMPVQVTPRIAAESQTIQSVLVGLQFDLPEVVDPD